MTNLTKYYSRPEIQAAIVEFCKDREVSASKQDGSHMARPMILQYPRDVSELVKKGAISFHCSVETWKNPMTVRTGMTPEEMNDLRKGWDLILDIDSMIGLEAAKVTVAEIVKFLKKHNVGEPTIKFSGSRGFHVGIPSSSFPGMIDYQKTSDQFPKIPRAIATFIKDQISDSLLKSLIEMKGGFKNLLDEVKEIESVSSIEPYLFVDIENNWGNRHLFRSPYSINDKTNLVTLPLKLTDLEDFKMEDASPEKVEPNLRFLDSNNDMSELAISALDWVAKQEKKEIKRERRIGYTKKIPEERFPPCMKYILNGLSDGRKRAVLILANFLRTMNWTDEEITIKIIEWNKRNSPPLPDNYVNTQLRWFERQDRMLPPNCSNPQFIRGIGACRPDEICTQGKSTWDNSKEMSWEKIEIKNPAVYPFKKKAK